MLELKRIFVVGHMGAGKALFSETLAKRLGWQYVDANPSLERYIGRNLRDIVGEKGEEHLHNCEADIITHYIGKENVVVVLEEGVVDSLKNRKLLSSEYVIYLKVSVAQQIKRMQDGRNSLLPITDLIEFLSNQHKARNDYYDEVATLILNSVGVDEDVECTVRALY